MNRANNLTIKPEKLCVMFFVMFAIWQLNPFFTWRTYHNGIFKEIAGISVTTLIFLFLLMALILYWSRHGLKVRKQESRFALAVFIIAFVQIGICGGRLYALISGEWIPYFVVILFMLVPTDMKKKVYKAYLMFFVISLIPALFYYILDMIGVTVPYSILETEQEIKAIRNMYYKHYPFATQLVTTDLFQRFSGIFDEAGLVGTLAALFLVSERMQFRGKGKWKNVVMLIAGALTLSLAFVLIIVAYYIVDNLRKRNIKAAAALVMIPLIYFIFMNIKMPTVSLEMLQARLEITSSGLAGNNRVGSTDAYMDLFQQGYTNSGSLFVYFFGNGSGEIGALQSTGNIDGSSYLSLLYNYGIIGAGLFLIWMICLTVYIYKRVQKDTFVFVLLIIYILNMYQRPSMFYPAFIFIFIGGLHNIPLKGRKLDGNSGNSFSGI